MDTLSLDFNTADSAAPHLLVAGDRIVGRIREQKDAQEIIAACNAHEQLVAALKDARVYVCSAYECAFPDSDKNALVLAGIDAALTAAGVTP